ncbi:MAG: thioredoxin family protein [Oscillatoriaceae bacterium SKW80]|nr:thioredoxin family protein [Oscillatoriaceae bacterium SKYG93]MCX8121289.1 thioredoxin family protein [Oscillatoriaceae bacterium SKW80]MDW8453377.1 thioredoxin family protein [Oscillatoriaceae cyanobacterium SKYGB_i_bin93]
MMVACIGSYAPDFELPGVDDQVHHLARYLENFQAVGVIFMSNNCPYVGLYIERLKQIQACFQARGFTLIGINPNDATQDSNESFENMKAFASYHQLNFPYIRDVTQDVAQCFGVQKTPEAFLLDKNGVICYRGQIDDNPDDEQSVQVPYLRQALAQLLDGKPITTASTEPVGCTIKWRQ